MSADNAVSRAQARTNSMINAAIQGGSVAELNHKNMTVALRIGRRNVKLVGGDGVPTREGTHYYNQLGVPPPRTTSNFGRQMGDDEEETRLLSL